MCIEGRNWQAAAVTLNLHSFPFKVRWTAFDPDDTQQSNGAVLYANAAGGGWLFQSLNVREMAPRLIIRVKNQLHDEKVKEVQRVRRHGTVCFCTAMMG